MQIDTVNNRSTPRITRKFGMRLDGLDITSLASGQWSVNHDVKSPFATASVSLKRALELSPSYHTAGIYAGWRDPLDVAFVGEVQRSERAFTRPVRQLTLGGYLARTNDNISSSRGFFYAGDTIPATSDRAADLAAFIAAYDAGTLALETQDLIDQIPLDHELCPIWADADIIVKVLACYGITPETTGISIDPSWWIPAKLSPILWPQGMPGYQLIKNIDDPIGYATADGRAGEVRRRKILGTVPGTVKHVFRQGIDIVGDPQLVEEYKVYNQVRVNGAQIPSLSGDEEGDQVVAVSPAGEPEPSPFLPSGVNTYVITSSYIETVADAQQMAAEWLSVVKQPTQEWEIQTFGCPDLDLGDGVGVLADVWGLSTNAFIVGHSTQSAPYRSTLRLRGSTFAEVTPNQPPTLNFEILCVSERMVDPADGVIKTYTLIRVTPTASDPDGVIASWTVTVGSETPRSGVGDPVPVTVATLLASPVAVTVTVTDDGGATTSLTRPATWDATTIVVEPLTLADGTQAQLSADGELTWKTKTPPAATVTAPTMLGGVLCYGAGAALWRSTDQLDTATLVRTFGATITCLWNNEVATSRWLAGLANGEVWLSIDAARTWTKLCTLAAAVNDIAESPSTPGEMQACAGALGLHTFSAAGGWQTEATSTGTMLRVAAGFETRCYGDSTGTIRIWSTASSTITTTLTLPVAAEVRGLGYLVEQQVLGITTSSTATYTWTPAAGLQSGPATASSTNHMMHSGLFDGWYISADAGLQKWIYGMPTIYTVRAMTGSQVCKHAGYFRGQRPPTVLTAELLLGGPDTLRHWTPATGWQFPGTGLPAGRSWLYPVVSSKDPTRWAVRAGAMSGEHIVSNGTQLVFEGTSISPVWYTPDNGAHFYPVVLGVPPTFYLGSEAEVFSSTSKLELHNMVWSATDPDVLFVSSKALYNTAYEAGVVFSGKATQTLTPTIVQLPENVFGANVDQIIPLPNGGIAMATSNAGGTTYRWIKSLSYPSRALITHHAYLRDSGVWLPGGWDYLLPNQGAPGGSFRAVFMGNAAGVGERVWAATPDVRSVPPHIVPLNTIFAVGAGGKTLTFDTNQYTLAFIADIATATVSAPGKISVTDIDDAAGAGMADMAVDRQTGTVYAVMRFSTDTHPEQHIAVRQNGSWSYVPLPAGFTADLASGTGVYPMVVITRPA